MSETPIFDRCLDLLEMTTAELEAIAKELPIESSDYRIIKLELYHRAYLSSFYLMGV